MRMDYGRHSHFWAGLMKAKENFVIHGSFCLTNGRQIQFWEEKLLRNYSFKEQYPSLYNIIRRRSATVASVISTVSLNVSSQRYLTQTILVLWKILVGRIMHVQLNDQKDVFIWNLYQHAWSVHSSLFILGINKQRDISTNKYCS
jgi:hypothetical protein